MLCFQQFQINQKEFEQLAELFSKSSRFKQHQNLMSVRYFHHYIFHQNATLLTKNERASEIRLQDSVNRPLHFLEQCVILSLVEKNSNQKEIPLLTQLLFPQNRLL